MELQYMPQIQKKSTMGRIIKDRWIYIALIPTFAFIFVFLVYPVFEAILKSFYYWKMSSYNNPEFIGLNNYLELLSDSLFWKSFGILGIFILWGFVSTLGILLPITYLVHSLGEGFAGRFVQRMYVIPMTIPYIVFILYWKFFYETNFGMLNNMLKMVGLEKYTHVWLGEEGLALIALLFQGFPWIGGFGFLVLLAGFQAVDHSLHESAELDGANSFATFTKIDIPLIIPQIKLLMILGMISGIQQFTQQLVMTQGGPNYTTMVPGLLLYKSVKNYGNLGYGSTMGVVLFLVIMAITLVFNKYIKKAD